MTVVEAYGALDSARGVLRNATSKGGRAAFKVIDDHLRVALKKKHPRPEDAAAVAKRAAKLLSDALSSIDRAEVMGATLNKSIDAVEKLSKGEDPRVVQLQTQEAAAQLQARREREKKVLREAWEYVNPVSGGLKLLSQGAKKAGAAVEAGLKWGTGLLVLVGGAFLVLALRKGR